MEIQVKIKKPVHVDKEIGSVSFDGKEFRVLEFTNESIHVEPCHDCCFGTRINLGTKQAERRGVVETVNESGYMCYKPREFYPCTAVNRKDKKNVYFKKS